jgi:N-alpha-acetyl-L-2,4-diaminobutyrate deacetylase
MAGNHGDEYPGQVAILRLMRELRPEQVKGRVILIPALNLPASKAATRLSPLDGRNLNRSFPGKADGTVTEMIAHYLTTVLFPFADIVIDIHTGGRSVDFVPCAHMHLVPAGPQREAMLSGCLARKPGTPTSASSMPTSPARDCCPSKRSGKGRP